MKWHIDSERSRIGFSVRHMLVATVHGSFKRYSGTIEIDPDDFTRSRFAGEIQVTSVDTGNRERDAELRTNAFFAMDAHPTISFVSKTIEPRGRDRYVVAGELEVRGVKRRVAVEVQVQPKTAAGASKLRFKARGQVNRKDFGLSMGPLLETGGLAIGDKVNLELDVEAVSGGETDR